MYHLFSENKGADLLWVTTQLINVFDFAYAKGRLSHNAGQMITELNKQTDNVHIGENYKDNLCLVLGKEAGDSPKSSSWCVFFQCVCLSMISK